MHALGGRSEVAEVSFAAAQHSNGSDPVKTTSGMETHEATPNSSCVQSSLYVLCVVLEVLQWTSSYMMVYTCRHVHG